MATYNNQYAMTIKPNTPTLRGIDTTYSNDGKTDLQGIGLGDLYKLDYDRQTIENIFNQGTDAQYALMQKENQIAQNQYANNMFAQQQSTMETLRQQRNEQIASGMARGLNAAQEQGTILGLQQENAAGALELANQRQLEADKIAVEYANNVAKALQESNSVKQAMAQVAATLYEADMLGYTGELGYMGQMDANASNRYGSELGLEGTRYSADKGLEGAKYQADMNYKGTKYAADRSYEAQVAAANITASSYKGGGGTGNTSSDTEIIQWAYEKGKTKEGMIAALQINGSFTKEQATTIANQYFKNLETTKQKPNLVVQQPTKTITTNGGTLNIPVSGPYTTQPFYTSDNTYNRYVYPTPIVKSPMKLNN